MIAQTKVAPAIQLTRTESELKKLNEKMDKMLIALSGIQRELAEANKPKR